VPGDPLRPTAADALAAWATRVRLNREQVDRFRELPDEADFYAPLADRFRADPRRQDDATLALLRSLVRPDDVVLDVGAGGGRYALPLALVAREVIAVEPSDGMLAVLRAGMAEHGIANVRPLQSRWPMPDGAAVPTADVALIANVGYDIEDFGPFLDALERAATRVCIAVMLERQPTFGVDALWPHVHGVPRSTLPSLPDFLVLQLARGRLFELRLVPRSPMAYPTPADAAVFARRQLWTRPGSPKDRLVEPLLQQHMQERAGEYAFSWAPIHTGVVTWSPLNRPT
jgi:SAM-dependent methyltransferase